MALTRTGASRLELARVEPEEPSLAHLTARLMQESLDLAVTELRRIDVEVKQQRRGLVRATAVLLFGSGAAAVAVATLAGGAVLYLGRVWSDYAVAAFVTGGLLLLLTVGTIAILRATWRHQDPPREGERSRGHES